ncbi:MAG: hypothetical protein ACE5JU_19870 [Candidatus Binatia bacterium]
MNRLSSRKLALAIAGLAALVGLGALEAFWAIADAKEIIAGVVFVTSGGIGIQALLDSRKPNG